MPSTLFSRPTSKLQALEIAFDEMICLVRLHRHARAWRYTLRIDASSREVKLTMPLRGSVREAKNFAQQHAAWIAARLRRLPAPIPFEHGAIVPLRGIAHRIAHRPGERGAVWITSDANGERLLCVAGRTPHLRRRVCDFLKRKARRELEAACLRVAQELGVTVRRVAVRDPSSRWGSCSATGVLSFSWRLILAPPFVLHYLAVHEVVHLLEMNHSPRFWRTVHQLCPDAARAKAWLKAHGNELHRYGAVDQSKPRLLIAC